MSIRVTEHAVARYCERVLGLDRGALERSMTELVGDAHSGRFKLPGADVIAVVENRTVLSFVPSGECPVAKARIKIKKKTRKQRPWLADDDQS